jgi:putative Mn2+ efflux pump MntP
MEILTIILIGISLTFDTFAVSVTAGLIENKIVFWQAVRIAVIFAFFQAAMPVLGWFVGSKVIDYIKDYDHWVAFGLLLLIGAKMIYEALKKEEEKKSLNPFDIKVQITLGIATSIDALIIGFSLAFMNLNIYLSTVVFGTLTFLVAMIGMLIGKKAGHLVGKKAEIIGGIILIGIGLKILIEHLFF